MITGLSSQPVLQTKPPLTVQRIQEEEEQILDKSLAHQAVTKDTLLAS